MKLHSLLTAGCLIFTAYSANASLLLETFEDDTLGSIAANWSGAGTPFSATVISGSSTNGVAPNQQLLHLYRTEATGGYSYAQTAFATQESGQLSISFNLQINNRASSDYAIMLGDSTGNASSIYLRFQINGSLSVYHGPDGGQLYSGKILAEETWYQFQFDIDLDSQTFTYGFNRLDTGEAYRSPELAFRGAGGSLNQFLVRSVNTGTTSSNMAIDWYLDDLAIQTIPEPGTIALVTAGLALLSYRGWRRL